MSWSTRIVAASQPQAACTQPGNEASVRARGEAEAGGTAKDPMLGQQPTEDSCDDPEQDAAAQQACPSFKLVDRTALC